MNDFNLNKQVFNKKAFNNTVDTTFTELTSSIAVPTGSDLPSIEEFFDYYQALFYQIPKFGEGNSHQYLIFTSQDYLGSEGSNNQIIDALIEEVTSLRQENLELQQQLVTSSLSSVEDAIQTLQQLNG